MYNIYKAARLVRRGPRHRRGLGRVCRLLKQSGIQTKRWTLKPQNQWIYWLPVVIHDKVPAFLTVSYIGKGWLHFSLTREDGTQGVPWVASQVDILLHSKGTMKVVNLDTLAFVMGEKAPGTEPMHDSQWQELANSLPDYHPEEVT